MASINSPDVLGVLVRHLAETDSAVRRSVIQELGVTGDPRATDQLLILLPLCVQDAPVFSETVRALAKLGHPRAADPLLKQLDSGEAELALVILQGLTDLLLQVRMREVVERSTARLVTLFEASEAVSKGDLTINDLVVKNMRPADATAVMEAVRTALKRLVGIEFSAANSARKFWNDREARERYLQSRTTGK